MVAEARLENIRLVNLVTCFWVGAQGRRSQEPDRRQEESLFISHLLRRGKITVDMLELVLGVSLLRIPSFDNHPERQNIFYLFDQALRWTQGRLSNLIAWVGINLGQFRYCVLTLEYGVTHILIKGS